MRNTGTIRKEDHRMTLTREDGEVIHVGYCEFCEAVANYLKRAPGEVRDGLFNAVWGECSPEEGEPIYGMGAEL